MNEVVDITCKAGAGHALQSKVKCFDLVCKRGGVHHSAHEKEERRVENLSHCMELVSCGVLSRASHSSDNGQTH